MAKNIIEALIDEIMRISVLKKEYEEIPNNGGKLAAKLMQIELNAAKKAISEGDTISMIKHYNSFKEFE